MALDFLKNLFLSEDKKVKITHIMSLMAVLSADGKVTDEEVGLLIAIAKREGLTDEEYYDIIKGKKMDVKPIVPKDDKQKIQYLKDATAMMLIDGNLNPEEFKICVSIGKRLGLPVDIVSDTITGMIAKYAENNMKQHMFNKKQSVESINTDKNVALDKQSGLKVEIVNNPGTKTPRPPFSDEEAFAMGTLAISLVGSKIQQPDAMMQFASEYEGYTADEVNRIMAGVTSDFPKALSIFSRMEDPLKKSYAAGFFATIIKACGAGDDAKTIEGWRNCLNEVLHLGGEVTESIEAGSKWYERFEHGKRKDR